MKIGIIGAGQIGSTLTRRLRGLRHEVHVANSKSLGELGFDAIDAGGLDDSWRQQPGTPVYTTDLNAEGVRKALSAAHRERTRDWTATLKSPGNFATPA
jgi:predicted dinucleotide-binding enzyme